MSWTRSWRSSRGTPAISRPWAMFLSTVRQGIRARFWNTTPRSGPGPTTDSPKQRTWPAVGFSRPAMSRSRVDFPHPLGPTTVTNSPGRMARDTSSRAWTPACPSPYQWLTRDTSIAGAAFPPRTISVGREASWSAPFKALCSSATRSQSPGALRSIRSSAVRRIRRHCLQIVEELGVGCFDSGHYGAVDDIFGCHRTRDLSSLQRSVRRIHDRDAGADRDPRVVTCDPVSPQSDLIIESFDVVQRSLNCFLGVLPCELRCLGQPPGEALQD